MKILITDVIKDIGLIEKKVFGKKYFVTICNAKKKSDISDSLLSSANGILAFDTLNFDKKFLKKLKKCKVLVRVGAGYDNIDLKSAKSMGMAVCNVPDYGVDEVADYAISSVLFTNIVRILHCHVALCLSIWTRQLVSATFRSGCTGDRSGFVPAVLRPGFYWYATGAGLIFPCF